MLEQRQPLAAAPAGVLEAVGRFAASKRLSLDGLEELGTRYYVERGGAVVLVWSYESPNGRTCAVKYRSLATGKRWAESGSTFPRPKVLGNPLSTDWLVAEGETDGARLWELTGGRCAVLVMPPERRPSAANGPERFPATQPPTSCSTRTGRATRAPAKPPASSAAAPCAYATEARERLVRVGR